MFFFQENKFKKSYNQVKKTYNEALKNKDTIHIIKNLLAMGVYQRTHLNYGNAFNHTGNALFLAEQFKDTLLIAKALDENGVLNYLYKQDELAGASFKKAHLLYKKAYKKRGLRQKSYTNPIII